MKKNRYMIFIAVVCVCQYIDFSVVWHCWLTRLEIYKTCPYCVWQAIGNTDAQRKAVLDFMRTLRWSTATELSVQTKLKLSWLYRVEVVEIGSCTVTHLSSFCFTRHDWFQRKSPKIFFCIIRNYSRGPVQEQRNDKTCLIWPHFKLIKFFCTTLDKSSPLKYMLDWLFKLRLPSFCM